MNYSLNKDVLLEYQAIANILHNVISINPDPNIFNLFKQNDLAGQWPMLANNNKEQQGSGLLKEFFVQWEGCEEQIIQLQKDFARLFCGPGKPLAGPWGSVYLCEGDMLNDDSTKALQQFYKKHDINLDLAINEPKDHLGMILAVLAYLLGLLAETPTDNHLKNIVSELLQIHVLPFSNRVMELVQQNALTAYFEAMGILGELFFEQLASQFNIIPINRKLYN